MGEKPRVFGEHRRCGGLPLSDLTVDLHGVAESAAERDGGSIKMKRVVTADSIAARGITSPADPDKVARAVSVPSHAPIVSTASISDWADRAGGARVDGAARSLDASSDGLWA